LAQQDYIAGAADPTLSAPYCVQPFARRRHPPSGGRAPRIDGSCGARM